MIAITQIRKGMKFILRHIQTLFQQEPAQFAETGLILSAKVDAELALITAA